MLRANALNRTGGGGGGEGGRGEQPGIRGEPPAAGPGVRLHGRHLRAAAAGDRAGGRAGGGQGRDPQAQVPAGRRRRVQPHRRRCACHGQLRGSRAGSGARWGRGVGGGGRPRGRIHRRHAGDVGFVGSVRCRS